MIPHPNRTSSDEKAAADQPAIRVVLVEDDHDLRQGLADYLRLSGVDVIDLPSGLAFYKTLRSGTFDIAILDVNLPDTSGFDLAKDLAAERGVGIIMLTARTSRDDRIRGYAEGADLYLTKPVDGEELLLAVRNLARRVREASEGHFDAEASSGATAWSLDRTRLRLLPPTGAAIALSGRELLLLECLAEAGGATISRATLAKRLGYAELGAESRSLDAVLRRLRQKAQDSALNLPLHAVHAVGVRFSAPLLLT